MQSNILKSVAARRLFHQSIDESGAKDGVDMVSKWHLWDEDFQERLDVSEHPLSVLVRTQTAFDGRKIGIYDPDTGEPRVYDVLGETITDDTTGEFMAGSVTCRDVTQVKEDFAKLEEKSEQRFEVICDSTPHMVSNSKSHNRITICL
jgi:hypothetical protein